MTYVRCARGRSRALAPIFVATSFRMPYRLPHPEAKPPKLRPSAVPASLHRFIPLAEKYGISDDGYREQVIDGLDPQERDELIRFLAESPDDLWDWLAGPESYSRPSTAEYIAFSALALAAESAKVSGRRST